MITLSPEEQTRRKGHLRQLTEVLLNPDERVRVLYPGPGPNAPFLLLATASFTAE